MTLPARAFQVARTDPASAGRSGAAATPADEELQRRFEEFEQIVSAIVQGEVDAFVVSSAASEQVFTLSNAERPYRLLVENMQQGGLTLGLDGVIRYANRQFARMLDVEVADLVGRSVFEFLSAEGGTRMTRLVPTVGTERQEFEIGLRRKNGVLIPALASAVLDEESSAIFIIVTDLTDARRQQALIAEEALSGSILEQAVDAILVCDVDGTVRRASHTARDLCIVEPVGLAFSSVYDLRGPGTPLDFKRLAKGDMLRKIEHELVVGAQRFTVLLSAGPVVDRGGQVFGVLVTMTDIEERKRAENVLREAHDQLAAKVIERTAELTHLSHHLMDVAEEERASIASELHDDMGGILTVLSMQLSKLQTVLPQSPEQAAELAQTAMDLVKEITASQRRIVNNLRPVMLDSFGLNEALRQHVQAWHVHTGTRVDIHVPSKTVPLTANESLALFRVLQESLTNVAKHARATSVTVALGQDERSVTLVIEDDGIGTSAETLDKINSQGIIGMRERVSRFGGWLFVSRREGSKGTRVQATIPTSAPSDP